MTIEPGSAEIEKQRVRVFVIVAGASAALVAVLPFFSGEHLDSVGKTRLTVAAICVIACALLYSGRLWARWFLSAFAVLQGAVAIGHAVNPDLHPLWRVTFAIVGVCVFGSIAALFVSAAARSHFRRVV